MVIIFFYNISRMVRLKNTSIYQYISQNGKSNATLNNFLHFYSADFESMINVLLCQPIITSHGLWGIYQIPYGNTVFLYLLPPC